jgi:uncharacterized membrane protein
MTRIRASVEIHVPVEKVSAFVDDWRNFEKWYVGIYDFKPTTEMTTGNGARFSYKVKQLGREIECEAEAFDYVENRGSKWKAVKGPKSVDQYELEPTAGGTRVTETVDYDVPPVLGSLMDVLFVKPALTRRMEKALQNLKRLLEG